MVAVRECIKNLEGANEADDKLEVSYWYLPETKFHVTVMFEPKLRTEVHSDGLIDFVLPIC